MPRIKEDLDHCSYTSPPSAGGSGFVCGARATRWFTRESDNRIIMRCHYCPDPWQGEPDEVSRKEAEAYLVMRA